MKAFHFKVGGAFQWPPAKEDVGQPAGPSVFMDPNQNSQQNVQQTQQSYQQNIQSNQQSQQQSYSFQQQSSTQQSFQQTTQQKPVSILKQTQQPTENSLRPQQNMQQESYSPGPGQQVTAPRRGKGELKQQQPGMRTPICGACDDQIRF